MKNPENIPNTLNEFMQIYTKYENDFKKKYPDDKGLTIDYLQYITYGKNPVTEFHRNYYSTKYSCKFTWTPYFFLFISLILLVLYFFGSFTNTFWFGIISEEKFMGRILFILCFFPFVAFMSYFLVKLTTKWSWKFILISMVIVIGIFYTIFIGLSFFEASMELIFDKFYSILGIAWAPTSFSIFLILKFKPYITDFGGIHLFLGWIYRVSEANGDIKTLNSSFYRLIYELDNWLNNVFNLVIKNKYEIFEGFYFNVISNKNFLSEIKINHKDLFEKLLQGLLVENLLHSDTFSNVDEEDKTIPKLKKFDLVWLNYRLAQKEIPKVIKLIETISTKDFEIIYYSPLIKLRKFKTKFISIAVFILTTLLFPLIISIFQ